MSTGPLIVFQWADDQPTGAVGCYVVDRIINNVCGGGITMGINITQQEVEDIALSMSKKFTVTSPSIGGGKGGIRFDPQDPRSRAVLRRYIIAMKQIFSTFVNTAGDIGTDDSFVEQVFQQDLGLQTCQSALACMIAEKTKQPNLNFQLSKLISFPANEYFALIEAAVGFGLLTSIRTVHKFFPTTNSYLRLAIQGFGAVGSSLAYYTHQTEGMYVTALSDKDGFVIADKCLPIDQFLQVRARHKQSLPEGSHKQEVGKNFFNSLLFECGGSVARIADGFGIVAVARDPSWTDEQYLCAFLSQSTADVFCPCAGRYAITEKVVDVLVKNTWNESQNPYIASGANNPFSKDQEDATEQLSRRRVCVIPHYVANSGTAQLFHRGLSIPFNLYSLDLAKEVLTACAAPIEEFLNIALASCSDRSQLSTACALLTNQRLEHPILVDYHSVQTPFTPLQLKPEERKESPNYAVPSIVDQKDAYQEYLTVHSEAMLFRKAKETLFAMAKQENPEQLNQLFEAAKSKELAEAIAQQKTHMAKTLESKNSLSNTTSYYAYPKMTEFLPGYQTVEERITKVLAIGIECINSNELEVLMRSPNGNLTAYDSFEPSNALNIAAVFMKRAIINQMTACGFTYIIWIADFFARLNLKQGGDVAKIKKLGEYFVEVFKSSGIDMERVRVLWAFDEVLKRPAEYFELMFDVSSQFSVKRMIKSMTALGRTEDQNTMQASRLLYPILQVCDINFLKVGVCQLGLDQRKINMLAREYQQTKLPKPVILSHAMMPSLKKGGGKMSKTVLESCIYVNDDEVTVNEKIRKAYCAEKDILENPLLQYLRWLIFPNVPQGVMITLESGEKRLYQNYILVEEDFANGMIHPIELKHAVAFQINTLLTPIRLHFSTDPKAIQLLSDIEQFCK